MVKQHCSCFFGWFCFSLLIILLDQQTKIWILDHHALYSTGVHLTSWLDIKIAYNSGAAFSFLSQASGWQRPFLSILAIIMSFILIVWLKFSVSDRFKAMAIMLLLGGAVGNLLDRLMYGYVIDFIALHYQSVYFPIFNVADISITIGALLLASRSIFLSK
ncbi:MAG: signal peptidase II [Endozoicomonadaceae bacterium]|nr:signal peptidase II [Endozoicomonadaceae bacterium]MBE8232620.1 signal peptidase II [Endozoicomonadaceae bacterium]